MKRGDVAVISVSAGLAAVVVAAVAFSVLVLDRRPRAADVAAASSSSLLVVTWAPSLCKVEPDNAGCRSGHVGRLGRTIVLHGLWPQPSTAQYCDVPKATADRDRNPVPLPAELQASLQTMTSDAAVMTVHEWYAHGTCSGITPAQYFGLATSLAEQAGQVLNPVFEQSAGRGLSARAVREAFDGKFGGGAGERIGLTCRAVGAATDLAFEVHLSLPPVTELHADPRNSSLAAALGKGPALPAGCGEGKVP